MKKENAKRSSLFLIELMAAILFFALASAVCIQAFAKSHTKSIETSELNMAVSKVQSAAEVFQSSDSPAEMLLTVFPEGTINGDTFTEYLDDDYSSCRKKDAFYILKVVISQAGQDQTAQITVSSNNSGKILYALEVKKHLPYTLEQSPKQADGNGGLE